MLINHWPICNLSRNDKLALVGLSVSYTISAVHLLVFSVRWNAETGLDLNFRVRQEVSKLSVTNIQALQLSSLLHVGWVVSTVKQERERHFTVNLFMTPPPCYKSWNINQGKLFFFLKQTMWLTTTTRLSVFLILFKFTCYIWQ